MRDGSFPITGQFAKDLYELQKKNEVIKPVRFLTQKHVEPPNLEKMHVGRAAEIFSNEVIAALSFLKEYPTYNAQAKDFRDCGGTISFMKVMQKWFAIDNVSNRTAHVHQRDANKMQFFFCATDERMIWLVYEFPKYLEALHDTCKRHKKKFLFSAEKYEALTLTSQSTVLCGRSGFVQA